MVEYVDDVNIRCKHEDTRGKLNAYAAEHDMTQEEAIRDLLPNIQEGEVELSGGKTKK